MKHELTIGEAARRSGVPARTIRFYEMKGVIPAPARTPAGYRTYTSNDLRRLQLARRARLLGLPLSEVTAFVTRAFASDCGAYAGQVLTMIDRQRAELDQRIAELQALRDELDTLEHQVRDARAGAPPGLLVASCGRCPLIDDRTGDPLACRCRPPVSSDAGPIRPIRRSKRRKEHAMRNHEIPIGQVLEVLACAIDARPAGAPSPSDLIPFVRDAYRQEGAFVVLFDPAAGAAVAAFAEAERQCCSGIGWEVEHGDVIRLRITATAPQLDVLEQAWPWTGGASR